LDEATSSIDNISQEMIVNTLKKIPNDIIIIIAAHRLDTIRDCNVIHVLSGGMISESGDHIELLKNRGIYYTLNRVNSA